MLVTVLGVELFPLLLLRAVRVSTRKLHYGVMPHSHFRIQGQHAHF